MNYGLNAWEIFEEINNIRIVPFYTIVMDPPRKTVGILNLDETN